MTAREPPASLQPSRRDRLAARVVTGPLGHLVAGVIDWFVLLGRLVRRRLSRTTAR